MLEPYVGFKVARRSKSRRSSAKYSLKKKKERVHMHISKTSTIWIMKIVECNEEGEV
jgi:hypothetical protein